MGEALVRKVIGSPIPELSGSNYPKQVGIAVTSKTSQRISDVKSECPIREEVCKIMSYTFNNLGEQAVSEGAFCFKGCPALQQFEV